MELREHQKNAIDRVHKSIKEGNKKIRVVMATGTGKTAVILHLVLEYAAEGCKVLLLSPARIMCEQFVNTLKEYGYRATVCMRCKDYSGQNILITTYQDVNYNRKYIRDKFHTIICDDIRFYKNSIENFSICYENSLYIGFSSRAEDVAEECFGDSEIVYQYTLDDAFKDGYSHQNYEYKRIERFCVNLLSKMGFEVKLNAEGNDLWGDFSASKSDKQCLIEIKTYKSQQISMEILNRALNQAILFKKTLIKLQTNYVMYLFMFCQVPEEIKQKIYQNNEIVIVDISNFIYLCKSDTTLYNELIEVLPFAVTSNVEAQPIKEETLLNMPIEDFVVDANDVKQSDYIERLKMCKAGRENGEDKNFEKICADILRVLFSSDFDIMQEQLETKEGLFRMDMVCSIKLKNKDSFWDFIKQFYHTNYIVFEFKNYSEEISQNVICTTEKYLSALALRNVAFIISRQGFDTNAQKVAIRSLKEHGKLIVSLTDEDLIRMISIKRDGREPSGYLMDQINQLLMHID